MLNIFDNDAFSMTSLTAAVNKISFVPGMLGEMNLFPEQGITTTTVAIEEKNNTLALIQTSERGSAPKQRTQDKRTVRDLRVPRLAEEAIIYAAQVQNVRAFGSDNQLEGVIDVVNQEMALVALELDMTLENLRLTALQGVIKDADGSTLYDLFSVFGISQIAEHDFELNVATTDVRQKCVEIYRLMVPELKMGAATFEIHALAGDDFFDGLVGHATTKAAYDRWQNGEALRRNWAHATFKYGGIMFHNYRGDDDGAMGVATAACHFFPVGAPGVYATYFAPGDTMDTVNTVGLPRYALPAIDPSGKNRYLGVELQSNPLPICLRPRVLLKAKHS